MTQEAISANFVLRLFRAAKLAIQTQHVSAVLTPLFTMTVVLRAFLVRILDRPASLAQTYPYA